MLNFAAEATASNTRPVVSGAQRDSIYFLKVSAIHAKPLIHTCWVYVFVFGLEFLAAHGRTVVHGA